MSKSPEIYQHLLDQCPGYAHPGLWAALPVSCGICRPPADSTAVLTALRGQFSDEDLCRSGVARIGQGGAVTLTPELCTPKTLVLPLHANSKKGPVDLLVEGGAIGRRSLPLFAVLGDRRIEKMLEGASGGLCVAFTMADLAVLISMGIPTTLASGLDQLSGAGMEEYLRWFEMSPFGSPSASPASGRTAAGQSHAAKKHERPLHKPLELILVSWSPSTLNVTEPAGLRPVISRFALIHEHLHVPSDNLYVWKATPEDLERLKFCLQYGNQERVRESLMVSLDEACEEMTCFAQETESKRPKGLASAVTHLQDVLNQPGAEGRQKAAWENYQQAASQELTKPLIKQAATTEESLERTLTMVAADIGQVLHPHAMLTCAKTIKGVREAGLSGAVVREDIQQLIKMTDQFLTLVKEIRQCQKGPRKRKG